MSVEPWIQTFTGVAFTPLDPKPEDVRIEDVAHHLALQCRYSGATPYPYSVAQHSLLVAAIVERWRDEPHPDLHRTVDGDASVLWQLPLAALLHDAAEAYLVDLPRPLKDFPSFGDGYKAVERKLEGVIERRFGLETGALNHLVVRHADRVALATEVRDMGMLARAPQPWEGLVEPWPMPPWETSFDRLHAPLRFAGSLRCGPFPLCPVLEQSWGEVERAFLDTFKRFGGKP